MDLFIAFVCGWFVWWFVGLVADEIAREDDEDDEGPPAGCAPA